MVSLGIPVTKPRGLVSALPVEQPLCIATTSLKSQPEINKVSKLESSLVRLQRIRFKTYMRYAKLWETFQMVDSLRSKMDIP